MDIDNKYHNMVEEEIKIINEIVADKNIPNINSDEIMKAIRSINRGKSADYHGLTIEHIANAGKDMENHLLVITNEIFRQGKVPETLKVGLLTPIFKNKGLKSQATNYRCITVLPVISKIVETIIKERIQKQVIETQNRKRRRFTSGSSPINSALPVEKCYREVVDNNAEGQVILLDAKTAFDKVIHSHMERKVYQAWIDDKHWVLIKSLHENTESFIKWAGQIPEPFQVNQAVRQGGILSTDLYKLYINQLLARLESANIGMRIGNISTNCTACADDVALLSGNPDHTQILINMCNDYAHMEGYELQPAKSVALNIKAKSKKKSLNVKNYKLGTKTMPTVESAVHLGIIRPTSLTENMTINHRHLFHSKNICPGGIYFLNETSACPINVEENIKKARRSAYGLFGGGYHGNNGLDPDTLIHLLTTYITSVVFIYGMELIIPKATPLAQLELFHKRRIKQILSLPTTADPAVYILSGLLPVETQIHIRALGLFNNICNQAGDSVEKTLARRQLIVKSNESNSWFIEIKNILRKYNMLEAWWYVDNAPKKVIWTTAVKRKIHEH